jgi:hypothetical protein
VKLPSPGGLQGGVGGGGIQRSDSGLPPPDPPARVEGEGRASANKQEVLDGRCVVAERDQAIWQLRGRARDQPGDSRYQIRGAGRAVRLRQDYDAAHDRGSRGCVGRRHLHRRPGHQRRRAEKPRHRHGVPELCAVSAHDRVPEHGVRPAHAGHGKSRDSKECRGRRADSRYFGTARPAAESAFRRPAWAAPSSAIQRCSCSTSP